MAIVGFVFTLFTAGYILGVWTACLVFRQPQRAYEDGLPARAADGVPAAFASTRAIVLGRASRRSEARL